MKGKIITEIKNIRFNEEDLKDFDRARKILGVSPGLWGEDAEVIKKSIKFVNEFHSLVWDQFLNTYSPMLRELIKKRLNEGVVNI